MINRADDTDMQQIQIKPIPTAVTACCVATVILLVYAYFGEHLADKASHLERIRADPRVIAFHPQTGEQFGNMLHKPLPVSYHNWQDESMVRYDKMPKCHNKLMPPADLDNMMIPTSDREVWEWIRTRITRLWDTWRNARDHLHNNALIDNFSRKRILILPGLLLGTDFARRSTIKNGGPLGELLQWADLIAGLNVLGHDVILEHDVKLATVRLLDAMTSGVGCEECYDLVYVDVMALSALPHEIHRAYRCRLRVLDVYGTQAMYNDPMYKELHQLKGSTGGPLLHLKQYNTFYPQTPDNSFLGFVVTDKSEADKNDKQDIAVLYGKDTRYARAKETYIKQLTRYVSVHYTMSDTLRFAVPGSLVNDGVLSKEDYATLLNKAKIVVGLGSPIEGTGAMEALAHGSVFINPRYTGDAQDIFKSGSKPTQRLITSQIPYLEQYVGPPYVYTIDINNITDVANTIMKALNHTKYTSMIPEEFTTQGYLERLSIFVENQNFCTNYQNSTWPPLASLRTTVSHIGDSCTLTCHSRGMVCEPMYFPHINSEVYINSLNSTCNSTSSDADIIHPSVSYVHEYHQCVLQEESHLFSCEGQSENACRICPCRRYRKYQIALPD